MEDINISASQEEAPHPEVTQESKEEHQFLPYVFAVLILIALAIAALFVFQFSSKMKPGFNIPTDSNHVILFDKDTLYAFDPEEEELKKLGTFSDIEANKASASSDFSTIALSNGNDIFIFRSYSDGGIVSSSSEQIENLVISNEVVLFGAGETDEDNERKIYRITDGSKEVFAFGSTPMFLDDGLKAAAGTTNGFRMFDFEAGDTLDTETPQIPIASTLQTSIDGNKLALVGEDDSVHVYDILSTRPLNLLEDFFLVVPGVYDAAVNSEGSVAYLRPLANTAFISVYNPNTSEYTNTEIEVSPEAQILNWSK